MKNCRSRSASDPIRRRFLSDTIMACTFRGFTSVCSEVSWTAGCIRQKHKLKVSISRFQSLSS